MAATARAPAGDATAAEQGPLGVVAPQRRGHSSGFITDVIVDLGFATVEQVEAAVEQSRTAGQTPEQVLLGQGVIDSERLAQATAERYGLDYVDLALYQIDMAAANMISVKSARRHEAVYRSL